MDLSPKTVRRLDGRLANRSQRHQPGRDLVLRWKSTLCATIPASDELSRLGPLQFGMNPSQVQALLGPQRTYEPWMGGNLNDSLLYPGLIIGFDKCDNRGPLRDSKLDEFRIRKKADVTFLKKPIFGMPENELVETLAQHHIRSEKNLSSYQLPDLCMELDLDEQGRVTWIEFWGKGLQWAGLPVEYFIDVGILECSPVWETLEDLCGKFPEQSREYHIWFITERLTHLVLINEIGFQLESRELQTNLLREEGLAKLKLAQTWDASSHEELIAFFEKLSLSQKLSNMWNRIKGKPYTGRGSSVRRSW